MESMGDENWRESFNLPKQQPPSNQSRSLSSPTAKSCKSYALLNSPVSSSQQRNFDRSERDRYFPIAQKFSADESFNLKKNLIESKLDELTLDIGPKTSTFGTTR